MRTRAEWFGLLGLLDPYSPAQAFTALMTTHYNTPIEDIKKLLAEPCSTMKEAIFGGINLRDRAVVKMRTELGTKAYHPMFAQWATTKS